LTGTAGVSPANATKGAQEFQRQPGIYFRALRSFAGGTPAVPANHLTGYRPAALG